MAKLRVYQLARELNRDNAEAVNSWDEDLKSP